ncbi:TPA: GNAT family N-acetyltransferase [Bacillus cereus]|nr:GNAT family N-acetyltransferase [Bacillus pacificus]HDR3635484.1 GNAT family N-acetyltransferase [Bacillus pacificus]HDR6266031.1 GNAT family N-acetyltransferase [Bacillus cereus]HDR7654248.1 GNAT family N-acetyltransferase [Bacillus pacificus]HDR7755953.1 GNAT family N-acetyltransferase [Bacillus paranthracis]
MQEFSIKDADSIYRISNQPEIFKFLPDWKSTKEQRVDWVTNYEIPANKAFLDAAVNTSNIDGHFLKLGVFIKETDEFIGWCCTGIKDELPSPNREIMYAISSEFQKKGYATKASKGLINYLFTNTNLDVINAVALINNVSSNKVIEKCGFTYLSQQTIENELYNHYILNKSEWMKKH